ncbi:GNAT family N-acetyltransferase [Dactylosporangium sp. CA-139066]|uniref:GNAT family N-acetyltransferase n=1 Tax=Dactylosporangium sp. CA-139066 TaxID=3239930 RepID=UPI003D8E04A1
MTITYAWRGVFTDQEMPGVWERVNAHSLGWVCARDADAALAGFVNVAWDGDQHAFILDTWVDPDRRRAGIGTLLVKVAAEESRAAGCTWLHVDFEPHLTSYYLESCGFRPTAAGLIAL